MSHRRMIIQRIPPTTAARNKLKSIKLGGKCSAIYNMEHLSLLILLLYIYKVI